MRNLGMISQSGVSTKVPRYSPGLEREAVSRNHRFFEPKLQIYKLTSSTMKRERPISEKGIEAYRDLLSDLQT